MIAKNANMEQKEEFIRVIEDTLKKYCRNGIDQKALRAGIITMNSVSVRLTSETIREGLCTACSLRQLALRRGEAFIHMEAIPTFEFLKSQVVDRIF